ncbi:NUDIX hydrolase [Magnetospirillum sp. LM-5]|nr:NUDIX hydrolase [Magnetospirillum sp. LM-5]
MEQVVSHPLNPGFRLEVGPAWSSPPALAERIAAIWQAEKTKRGDRLTNGPVYGLESAGLDVLRIQRSDYRHVLARRLAPDLVGDGLTFRPLGVTGLLLCADGLVLGQRGIDVATDPGLWEAAPAGGLAQPDPRRQVLDELHEELGIGPADITAVEACGLVEDLPSGVLDIVFRLHTPLSGAAVRAAYGALATDEYARVAIVAAAALADFLKQNRQTLLPALVPMLKLAGLG